MIIEKSSRAAKNIWLRLATRLYTLAQRDLKTTTHKDESRKRNYLARHKNENWNLSGIDTAVFWARWLRWNKPTIKESISDIKRRFQLKDLVHSVYK